MQNTNSSTNNIIFSRIVKHTFHTLIFLFMLLLAISTARATFVLSHLRSAANNDPFNLALTARWSPLHPPLYRTFLDLDLAQEITPSRPPLIERMLLSVPNVLVNFGLHQTRELWQPATPAHDAAIASRSPAPEITAPPPFRDRTTSAPPDPAVEPIDYEPEQLDPDITEAEEDPVTDPDAKWATVITPAAPIYNSDGQRRDNILPGSVFEIFEQRTSGDENVYVGNVHTPEGVFENIVIRAQDLKLYHGKSLRDTSREERERASEKARIKGAITARKQEIEAEHHNQNPFQQRYIEGLRRYQTLRDEARSLRVVYDESSGTERINAGSRLRELRNEIELLTPAIRNLQQQRDAWRETNDLGPAPDPEQDAKIIALQRELTMLAND